MRLKLKTIKRIGSLLLAFPLVLGVLPYVAAADDDALFFERPQEKTDYAYSFAVVGDTQTHVYQDLLNGTSYTHNLYKWIVDNKEQKNIKWVFGLGDITENQDYTVPGSDTAEWELAKSAISRLDTAEIPYSLVQGNHDNPTQFNNYFGPGNAYASTVTGYYDESSISNHYINFEVAGTKYMVLSLQFGPSDEVLAWADGVIAANPDRRVIVTTHMYLEKDGSLANENSLCPPPWGNNGDMIWEKMVRKHRNIVMVLSGHLTYRNVGFSQQTGVYGNTVSQFLIDPQDRNYNEGFVCMLYFSADGKEASAEWISTARTQAAQAENPNAQDILYGESNQFDFTVTALDDPSDHPMLSALTVNGTAVSLTAGELAYQVADVADTTEKVLVSATAASSNATVTVKGADADGYVTLGDPGTTTTLEVAVTCEQITTTYTVKLYRKRVPWDSRYEPFANIADSTAGSESNPYQIANAEQLSFLSKLLRETVTVGDTTYAWSTFSGKQFKLTNDIDLSDNVWTPIGTTSATPFQGVFDGDNHEITGLKVESSAQAGLFGFATGTIKNLSLEGNVSTTASNGAAGFVGYVSVSGTLTLNNCVFTGSVTSTSTTSYVSVGALVGHNWNGKITLENCAAVDTTITASGNAVGGLVGIAISGTDLTIKNSYFSGTINGGRGTGGLVGGVYYGNASNNATDVTITNSYSEGTLTSATLSGGLVGFFNNQAQAGKPMKLTIKDSYSTATLNQEGQHSAGLVGPNHGWQDYPSQITVTIENSYFAGVAKYPLIHSSVDNTNKTDLTPMTVNLTNVYYRAGSATTESAMVPTADREKTVTEFADGTVTGLLNGSRTLWKQGTTHPVFEVETTPLATLTVGGVSVNLTENPFSYNAGEVMDNPLALVATPAKNGAKVSVSAVDNTGDAAAVENGAVTLVEGRTTTITIAVTYKFKTTKYTVTVYCKPGAWNGQAAKEFAGGSGSSSDPILIATPAQLKLLADNVNGGNNYASTHFKLTSNIDLGGRVWTPIGTASTTPFKGILDGDNHKIIGLKVESSAQAGLFGYAAATIKNLSLEGDVSTTGSNGAAGFVGYVSVAGTMTFSNCSFTGTVTSTSTASSYVSVGAFVGHNWNGIITLDNCTAVDTTITTSGNAVGGLVGIAISGTDLTIKNSSFSGTINGGRGTGGLVGGIYYGQDANNATDVTITNSYSEGTVTSATLSGGLVGFFNNQSYNNKPMKLTIRDSYSTATLNQSQTSAGFVGPNHGWQDYPSQITVTIEDSHFAGKAKYPILNASVDNHNKTDLTPMTVNLTNVYYVEDSYVTATTTVGDFTPEATHKKTVGEFADGTVSGLLGSGWATSTKGYPVHSDFVAPTNALKVVGTSIRTSTPNGMRFHFKVSNDAQTSNLLECGVVLAKASNCANGLYLGSTKSKYLAAIDGNTTKFVREDIEGYDWFTALLTFASDANNETAYNAKAYAVYEDAKGQEVVIYSEAIDGNNGTYNKLYDVAVKALEVADQTQYSEAELKYLNKIVGKEYGGN